MNLGTGSAIAQNTIIQNTKQIADLINASVDINRYGNVNNDMQAVKERFMLPWSIDLTSKNYPLANGGCSSEIECLTGDDFDLLLDTEVDKIFVVDTCAIDKVSIDAVQNALASVGVALNKLERKKVIDTFDTQATEYVGTHITLYEAIIGMINNFNTQGYDADKLVIVANPTVLANLKYQTLTTGQTITKTLADITMEFGVSDIIEDTLLAGDTNIYIYLKDYMLIGNMCKTLPYLFDGQNEYKDRTMIKVHNIYGAKFVNNLDDEPAPYFLKFDSSSLD